MTVDAIHGWRSPVKGKLARRCSSSNPVWLGPEPHRLNRCSSFEDRTCNQVHCIHDRPIDSQDDRVRGVNFPHEPHLLHGPRSRRLGSEHGNNGEPLSELNQPVDGPSNESDVARPEVIVQIQGSAPNRPPLPTVVSRSHRSGPYPNGCDSCTIFTPLLWRSQREYPSGVRRSVSGAVDCNLEGTTDLTHTSIAQPADPFDKYCDRDGFH